MKTLIKWLVRAVWIAVIAGAGWWAWRWYGARKEVAGAVRYRTAPVVRADVFRTVEATGTVQPIKEVEVGAQVNGRILIDPLVYEANYKSALGELHANQANVKKCEAQLVLAEKTLVRKEKLSKREMAPVADYDSALETRDVAVASLAAAKASVEKSEASVSQAKANLGYCTIVSPVSGVVITRSVDEGQTVVSSMNAVPLLKIATDLRRIQVEATVPEADIGNVHDGQVVTFAVDSYPGHTFTGVVTQVRMASTTTSSVVTYPVIIEADNPSGKLFPGMTANISVHIAEARGVLAVSSAAFRYHPPTPGGPGAGPDPHAGDKSKKTLWLLGANGEPESVEVGTGLSDGSVTEIKGDAALEGREAVLGVMPAMPKGGPGAGGPSNPFMPKRPARQSKNSAKQDPAAAPSPAAK